MTKQFWLVDSDPTRLTVAFMPAGGQKINKMTLQIGAGQQQVSHFLQSLEKLRGSQRFTYLSFASRFWEMPLLVFAKRETAEEIIQLVTGRQQVLTSLDSPFKVINHYPKLWNQQEVSQLADWQHNAHFLDTRTLDGRIDHGELSRYKRYLSQLSYPQPAPGSPLTKRLAINLPNLQRLFNTPLFQECWEQHGQIIKKFRSEITKDPREKWQGMMTIMPTTTDAETIEAILYRDHHIHDRPRITVEDPGIISPWGRKLLTFYRAYDGIDRHDPYALRRVHLTNKDYRPPLILNEDQSWFALLPSEGGLHGFTVRKNDFLASNDYQQSNNFNQPNHAANVLKIERPLINQELLLQMGCFDPHAQKIVQEMVDDVNGHELAPSLMSKLEQKLLHAMKGSSDTAFDNHLKQPNTILQMRLNIQLKLIRLCELLVAHHFTLLSVNSTIIYVAPAANAPLSLLNHLPDGFHVTDRGKDWFGKSPNDHLYLSGNNGYQVAGDNVNHYAGPNNWTDQQRPTITEKVLVEYLMKQGYRRPVNRQAITVLLQQHLRHFRPQEWFQPILSSKLKQIFAIADNGKQALVADPVLTGFFTTDPTDYTVTRVFSSNNGPSSDSLAEQLAGKVGLDDKYRLSKRYLKVEQRQIYNSRHLCLFFDPQDINPQQLIKKIDLTAYQQIVITMLNTWLPHPSVPSVDQLELGI